MAGAGIEAIRVGRGANSHIMPLDALKVDPSYNGRPLNREHVDSLKAKIRAEGYDESKPIRIRNIDGQFFIRDGLHRYTAMSELASEIEDIRGIPAVVAPKGTNDIDDVVNMLNANDGLRFTPLEEGALFKRVLSYGVAKEVVAKRVGRSTQYIDERLSLMGATPEIQEAHRNGTISASAAAKASKLDTGKQREIVRKAKETGKTVRVKDVQREKGGVASTVSTRKIRNWLKRKEEEYEAGSNRLKHYQEAVEEILALD
jgi:ParB family chromosome partitioning protein